VFSPAAQGTKLQSVVVFLGVGGNAEQSLFYKVITAL